jgi:hypothetical protein
MFCVSITFVVMKITNRTRDCRRIYRYLSLHAKVARKKQASTPAFFARAERFACGSFGAWKMLLPSEKTLTLLTGGK